MISDDQDHGFFKSLTMGRRIQNILNQRKAHLSLVQFYEKT